MEYLDLNGVKRLWEKIKAEFAVISHSHKPSDIGAVSVEDTNKLSQVVKNLYLQMHPVGSIYVSLNNTSPETLFGGTWERIKGCTLAGIDEEDNDVNTKTSFNQASGTKIGSKYLMRHYHDVAFKYNGDEDYQATFVPQVNWGYSGQYNQDGMWIPRTYATHNTGNGDGENIQPTLLVYMWERIA